MTTPYLFLPLDFFGRFALLLLLGLNVAKQTHKLSF